MKKVIVWITFLTIAGAASAAGLVNGGFDIDSVPMDASLTEEDLGAGWRDGAVTSFIVTPFLEMGRGDWNRDRYWVGQIWTDSRATTGLQDIKFDVVVDDYSSVVTGPQMVFEVYGANVMTIGRPQVFDLDGACGSNWSLIGSRLVYDVSSGVANNLSQSVDFGSGYQYLGLRITAFSTGLDGEFGEDIGIDNLSIGSDGSVNRSAASDGVVNRSAASTPPVSAVPSVLFIIK